MSQGLEIDCQDLVELVTDYFEGVLPEPDRRRFEDHVGLCDGCDAYIAQLRETVRVVGRLDGDQLAPEVRDTLLSAFRGWAAGRA